MNVILLIIIVVGFIYLFKTKENFGWACYYTPQKNYYKDKWLLGDNSAAKAMTRDAIKEI